MSRIPVAILGATGAVGQKFISLLDGHPMFEVKELVASPRSAGNAYRDAVHWKQPRNMPAGIADMTVKSLQESLDSRLLFSGLDSSVAGEAETRFAQLGHVVVSNSRNHRMDADVPLVIPEINADHLALLSRQVGPGRIVTNSNCSTMFLTMALAPLHRAFGVSRVHVVTMQAISGAGYPGVPAADILGNVVPYISGEEDKLETEPQKILGTLNGDHVKPADMVISAQCNRVPVFDGHLENLSVELVRKAGLDEVRAALREYEVPEKIRKLPSAPESMIVLRDEDDRPQPGLDLMANEGMSCVIGRLRSCPVWDLRMAILGHNTIRGAAGAAILNAEYLHTQGLLER